ncbi:hypothetical protein ABPG72_002010 [Tetrahymena utriculariae]
MGGGSSKKKDINDIEKNNQQGPNGSSSKKNNNGKNAQQISNNSPVKGGYKRHKQFEASKIHLQSHELNELKCMTANKRLVTDFVVGNNRSSQSQYQSILDQLSQGEGQLYYQDPNFPAQLSSLTKDINTFERAQKLTWKRPQQFMVQEKGKPLQYFVFQKGIEPDDVLQGDLGDCYFMSALCCLAERPGLIERLFETKEVNQHGCYCVWLCHDGEWTQVVLDDFFPCFNDGGPAFSRSHDNELWALLLEKAYAKLFGAYDKIESGLAGHAIHDLTGAPYEYFIRDNDVDFDENDIWDFLIENLVKRNYIVTASSEQNTRHLEQNQDYLGIISNHSYSILDAKEVTDSEGQKDRIIQIRNPWGQFEWKGDWSDNSYKWTQRLAQELKVHESDDGIFWMSINDFQSKFQQIMVSKVENNYKYSSIRSSKAPVQEKVTVRVFTMKVFSRTKCFIGASQRDKRNFAKNPKFKNYNYSLMRIMVSSLDSDGNDRSGQVENFVGSAFECERDISFETHEPLEPGIYLVYVECDWAQDDVREFVVWCYGENPVEFLEIKSAQSAITSSTPTTKKQFGDSALIYENLVDDLIESHQECEETDRIHRYNDQIYRTCGSVCGYVYFLYENASQDVHLREELTMKKYQYLEICSPKSFPDQVKVNVAPGDRQVIKYRVDARGRGEYSYQTSVNYILLQHVDPDDESKLMQLALLSPSKVKQREMHGHQMKIFVHTFVYYGGVCFLYINKTSSKTYVEDLELEIHNLDIKTAVNDPECIHIEVPAQTQWLLNLVTIDLKEDIAYKPKMTYYLK